MNIHARCKKKLKNNHDAIKIGLFLKFPKIIQTVVDLKDTKLN